MQLVVIADLFVHVTLKIGHILHMRLLVPLDHRLKSTYRLVRLYHCLVEYWNLPKIFTLEVNYGSALPY